MAHDAQARIAGQLWVSAEEGLNEAARFEMLWLQNKRNYYQAIAGENRERLAVLEERFR